MGKIPVPAPEPVWAAIRARLHGHEPLHPPNIIYVRREGQRWYYAVWIWVKRKSRNCPGFLHFYLLPNGENYDPHR